jgi:hypothetical protein
LLPVLEKPGAAAVLYCRAGHTALPQAVSREILIEEDLPGGTGINRKKEL